MEYLGVYGIVMETGEEWFDTNDRKLEQEGARADEMNERGR